MNTQMTYSDKILGTTIDAGQTRRRYSQYKIEHTGSPLEEIVTVTEEVEQELEDGSTEMVTQEVTLEESEQTLRDYFTGAIQTDTDATETYTDSDGKSVQYDNRVRVEDATTRDEVQAELADPIHTSEFSLTDQQKYLIQREGAVDDGEVDQVLENLTTVLDRDLVDDETRLTIAQTIDQIKTNNPELGGALADVYEVFTGETPTETSSRVDPPEENQ